MSIYNNLRVYKEESIFFIVIDRPKYLNALNNDTIKEISDAIKVAQKDAEIKSVVITGAGQKAFVAGADITHIQDMTSAQAREFSLNAQRVLREIECLEKPVIAAINGYCLGGGCELALACDLRIASENAKFGLPELGLGVIPGAGGTQRLARLIGEGRAKHIIFAGEIIDADKALQIGLVTQVFCSEELMAGVKELAQKIASKGQVAVHYCKTAINEGMQTDLDRALGIEANLFALSFATEDQKEGMKAFVEKRPAQFKGK